MRDLSERLRSGNFRHAVEAVAALRQLDSASGRRLIPSLNTADEQRAFQLLIAQLVVEGGVRGLAARWGELPSPQWREMLVSEVGQAFHLWIDEGTIELLLAALDDPETPDRDNLPWPTSVLAEKKGIPPGTPFVRVWSNPTGLLDLKGLEEAIERIRRRTR